MRFGTRLLSGSATGHRARPGEMNCTVDVRKDGCEVWVVMTVIAVNFRH
jgi:hypothetical protein